MIQTNQQNQHSEVPHFRVIDLFKLLAHKDDLMQHCCNENQHLKMMMNQKTSHSHPRQHTTLSRGRATDMNFYI